MESLRRIVAAVVRQGGPELSFFETLTVAAADLFAAQSVDLAVMEVGLGGRLDATRVFPSEIVVITNIDLDHQQYLGDTLEAIADEKFALTRRGAVVVAGDMQPQLGPRLEERARRTRSPLWRAGRDFSWQLTPAGRLDYRGPGGELGDLPVPLPGAHQAHNKTPPQEKVSLRPD